jgi:hypothetical protein
MKVLCEHEPRCISNQFLTVSFCYDKLGSYWSRYTITCSEMLSIYDKDVITFYTLNAVSVTFGTHFSISSFYKFRQFDRDMHILLISLLIMDNIFWKTTVLKQFYWFRLIKIHIIAIIWNKCLWTKIKIVN